MEEKKRTIELALSKDELKQLVQLVFLGDIVVDRGEPDPLRDSLVSRILQLAQTHRAVEGIEYSADLDNFFLTAQGEQPLLEPYEDFVDESFWGELTARLSVRDALEKLGKDRYAKLSLEERIQVESEFEDQYAHEFETSGVDRLRIVEKGSKT